MKYFKWKQLFSTTILYSKNTWILFMEDKFKTAGALSRRKLQSLKCTGWQIDCYFFIAANLVRRFYWKFICEVNNIYILNRLYFLEPFWIYLKIMQIVQKVLLHPSSFRTQFILFLTSCISVECFSSWWANIVTLILTKALSSH